MKKLIIGIAGIMIAGLTFATIYNQQITQNPPPSEQPIAGQNHQELQKESEQQVEQLQPIYVEDETIGYALQNNELHITFDKGENWLTVPVEKDKLFAGEYNGDKEELINNSFILTENRVALLYMDKLTEYENKIVVTYSLDQGTTWKHAVVTKSYPTIRFRKVAFLNDTFGYVILSGDRTMSQELSSVFLTHDGGENWEETSQSGVTRLLSDGGFKDEKTGFLSYGTINPEEPDFHVTQDGGDTWTEAMIHIPEKYDKIFVTAEMPVKEGDHLALLVNQGPNGDYKGGKVKGKFISKDNGKTWSFLTEVKPDE